MAKYIGLVSIVWLGLMGLSYFLWHSTPSSYYMPALLIANTMLAVLCIVTYSMVSKSLTSPIPHAFIRAKSAGTMLRIFLTVAGIVGFAMLHQRPESTKPTIFLVLGMYVVYTIVEAAVLSNKSKSNPSSRSNE